MDNSWLDLLQNNNQLSKVIETNQYTERFGLSLSQQDAQLILHRQFERDTGDLRRQTDTECIQGLTSRNAGATNCIWMH